MGEDMHKFNHWLAHFPMNRPGIKQQKAVCEQCHYTYAICNGSNGHKYFSRLMRYRPKDGSDVDKCMVERKKGSNGESIFKIRWTYTLRIVSNGVCIWVVFPVLQLRYESVDLLHNDTEFWLPTSRIWRQVCPYMEIGLDMVTEISPWLCAHKKSWNWPPTQYCNVFCVARIPSGLKTTRKIVCSIDQRANNLFEAPEIG